MQYKTEGGWVIDERNNRASIDYWGGKDKARESNGLLFLASKECDPNIKSHMLSKRFEHLFKAGMYELIVREAPDVLNHHPLTGMDSIIITSYYEKSKFLVEYKRPRSKHMEVEAMLKIGGYGG